VVEERGNGVQQRLFEFGLKSYREGNDGSATLSKFLPRQRGLEGKKKTGKGGRAQEEGLRRMNIPD